MELVAYQVIAALLVLVGIAGTVVPVLPGVPLVFGGLALAAWAEGLRVRWLRVFDGGRDASDPEIAAAVATLAWWRDSCSGNERRSGGQV